eukprot:SAG31_NODE_5063_length_2763_cov_8.216967_3_plen_171_part_00
MKILAGTANVPLAGEGCHFPRFFVPTIRETRDFDREKYGTNREGVALQRKSPAALGWASPPSRARNLPTARSSSRCGAAINISIYRYIDISIYQCINVSMYQCINVSIYHSQHGRVASNAMVAAHRCSLMMTDAARRCPLWTPPRANSSDPRECSRVRRVHYSVDLPTSQ